MLRGSDSATKLSAMSKDIASNPGLPCTDIIRS